MIGIAAYGAYIPIYRLSRTDIAAAWKTAPRGGEKSVANFDEDSVTMAVAACRDCLINGNHDQVDSLYMASTTFPYLDKQAAALVAEVLDIPRQASTVDFGDSLRAGTTALINAVASVKSGIAHRILVTIADGRLGAPKSDFEQLMGYGAAAFEIADCDVVAEIVATASHHDEFTDTWRQGDDHFIKSGEDRFVTNEGYLRNVKQAATEMMNRLGLSPADIYKLVLYTPDFRSHVGVARQLGFDPKSQLQDTLIENVGNIGSASVPLMLVGALEDAEPDQLILVVSYGDGCDTLVLKTNKDIKKFSPLRGLKGHLVSKMPLRSYIDYLAFHKLLPIEPMRRSPPISSLPARWRAQRSLLSLYGCRCRNCNTIQFPIQRICHICRAKDDFDEVPLSNLRGKIFTFTKDNMAPSGDLPTVMTVLELENGCRFFCQMTDRDPDTVDLGMEVELTFRKLFDYAGYTNYYWKCRPVR